MLKIASWNVNSVRARLPHLVPWIEDNEPDIIALQETKTIDEDFPLLELRQLGYSTICSGQKSYNGVAILSRENCLDHINCFPNYEDPSRRILAATVGDIRVVNLYIPNGQRITSPKFQYKLAWLEQLKSFLSSELAKHAKVIVLGDFNIAPSEMDVYDPKVWEGKVLFTEVERETFKDILKLGFDDYFRTLNPYEKSYSWWDYRIPFMRNLGLRIDHVLTSDALSPQYRRCYIDSTPRSWDKPSDHAPIVAEFDI